MKQWTQKSHQTKSRGIEGGSFGGWAGAGALADISLIELNDKTNDGQRGKGEGEAERKGQGDVVDKDKHCTSTVRKKQYIKEHSDIKYIF